jgi:hypothetical protein
MEYTLPSTEDDFTLLPCVGLSYPYHPLDGCQLHVSRAVGQGDSGYVGWYNERGIVLPYSVHSPKQSYFPCYIPWGIVELAHHIR